MPESGTEAILAIARVSWGFGGMSALTDVSFECPQDAISSFGGPIGGRTRHPGDDIRSAPSAARFERKIFRDITSSQRRKRWL